MDVQVLVLQVVHGEEMTSGAASRRLLTSTTRHLGARRRAVAVRQAVLVLHPLPPRTQSTTVVSCHHRRLTDARRRFVDIISAVGRPSNGRSVQPRDQLPRTAFRR